MSIRDSYNRWAEQYDEDVNKTRDLEHVAIKDSLQNIAFTNCLEIGCGTGKNTRWLARQAKVTAVDFSEAMLQKAKAKEGLSDVRFIQADITVPWRFDDALYDLISFSLVLEHIEHLDFIFKEACRHLDRGGFIYLGELHPFKQYAGSKARFNSEAGRHELKCFTHSISHFIKAAQKEGLMLINLEEYFDADATEGLPRILTLLFKKG